MIRINNHVRFTRMSRKKYEAKCPNLSQQCRKEVVCDEHTSILNLRQITLKLKKLIYQSSGDSADWKRFKKIQSRSFGYLSSAINNPEIKTEVELISALVDKFNKIILTNLKYSKGDLAIKNLIVDGDTDCLF